MAQYGFKEHTIRKPYEDLSDGSFIPSDPDLYLIVGRGRRKRKISAYGFVLMEASPFFNSMLSGDWKEGKEYRKVQGARPIRIRLPDDEPEAMRILVAILTLEIYPARAQAVETTICRRSPSIMMLRHVSILAEKYLVRWTVCFEYWDRLATLFEVSLRDTKKQERNARRAARLIRHFGSDPRWFLPHDGEYLRSLCYSGNLRPLERKSYKGM